MGAFEKYGLMKSKCWPRLQSTTPAFGSSSTDSAGPITVISAGSSGPVHAERFLVMFHSFNSAGTSQSTSLDVSQAGAGSWTTATVSTTANNVTRPAQRLYIVAWPTGTSIDIRAGYNSTATTHMVASFAVNGLARYGLAPKRSATNAPSGTTAPSVSFTLGNGEFALLNAVSQTSATSWTWSGGATELTDSSLENLTASTAIVTKPGSYTITATPAASQSNTASLMAVIF